MYGLIYNNCDELPIYYFYKILDEKNVGYLYKDYNGKELSVEEKVNLEHIFNSILYEYSELTFNRKILNKFNSELKILDLEFKYDTCQKILELYSVDEDFEILEMLNRFNYNVSQKRNIENQVNMVIKSLKGLKNKIKIEKANYIKKNKVNDDIKINLDDQATSLEMNLKIGYRLDTKIISVSKWISLTNAQEKLLKQNGN